jgi:hypothetical protein
MNQTINQFKTTLFDTIFSVTFKIWSKVSMIYLIQLALSFIIIFPILGYLIGVDTIQNINISINESDPNEIIEQFQTIITDKVDLSTLTIGMFLIVIIALFISAWCYNAYFIIAEQYTYTNNTSLIHALKNSFNANVFKILGLSIYLFVSTFFIFSIASPIIQSSGLLNLVIIPGIIILMTRFIIALPAVVISNMTIIEALTFSWKNITIKRAAKILGIGVITVIALGLIIIVFQLIMIPLAFLGIFGTIITQLFSIIVQGFFGAFIVSSLMGLYFRYSSEDLDTNDNMIQ